MLGRKCGFDYFSTDLISLVFLPAAVKFSVPTNSSAFSGKISIVESFSATTTTTIVNLLEAAASLGVSISQLGLFFTKLLLFKWSDHTIPSSSIHPTVYVRKDFIYAVILYQNSSVKKIRHCVCVFWRRIDAIILHFCVPLRFSLLWLVALQPPSKNPKGSNFPTNPAGMVMSVLYFLTSFSESIERAWKSFSIIIMLTSSAAVSLTLFLHN